MLASTVTVLFVMLMLLLSPADVEREANSPTTTASCLGLVMVLALMVTLDTPPPTKTPSNDGETMLLLAMLALVRGNRKISLPTRRFPVIWAGPLEVSTRSRLMPSPVSGSEETKLPVMDRVLLLSVPLTRRLIRMPLL